MLAINADDWGLCREATDTALACYRRGRIASASAMVFMEDSGRAAELAGACGIDVGLHLNLSQPFSGLPGGAGRLGACHARVGRFLRSSKYALLLYHPGLRQAFQHVFDRQVEEFNRLYGRPPSRVDGHHHLHLCTNMLWDGIIPRGMRVRRSFSFFPGEKGMVNRGYRRWVDGFLVRRYVLTDYFFSLSQQLRWRRLDRVAQLAARSDVELMVHPRNREESEFLMGGDEDVRRLLAATGRSAPCA